MSSESNTESNSKGSPPKGKVVKRSRRPLTSAEKVARQEKRLRDQYGNSRLDPDEPLLHGLTAAALQCAFTLLRQAYRKRGRYQPKTIADDVARFCALPADHRELLLKWLIWVKPRRWVLQEEGRSSVVAWANTSLRKSAIWTAELDTLWRAALESPNATKAVDRAPSNPSQQPGETVAAVCPARADAVPPQEVAPQPDPNSAARMDRPASHSSSDRTDSSGHPKPSVSEAGQHALQPRQVLERTPVPLSSTEELIDRRKITAWPKPAFHDEAGRAANGFARAALNFIKQEGSADALRVAAGALRNDVTACREFCERSPAHRKFLESIFEQLGWEVP